MSETRAVTFRGRVADLVNSMFGNVIAPCENTVYDYVKTNKEIVHNLHALAVESSHTIQPEGFWDDVKKVCDIAQEAAFHLSETLPEDRSGPHEYAAAKFLKRWDGRDSIEA